MAARVVEPLFFWRRHCLIVLMKPIYRSVITGLSLIAATTPVIFAQTPADPAPTEIAELRQQIQDLTQLVKSLKSQVDARPDTASVPIPQVPEKPRPRKVDAKDSAVAVASKNPTEAVADPNANLLPVPSRADGNRFNPEISAAVDTIGSYSASANNLDITVRNIEVMVQSNVDQFARAYLVLNAESGLDPLTRTNPFADLSVGVEEAAIETTSLPFGLAVKAGQFYADFTRLGKVHSHELPFVDRPASEEGILGGEAKARGFEVNWVPPVDHYLRLTAGAVDNIGGDTPVTAAFTTLGDELSNLFAVTTHRSLGDVTYYGRAATIFELGDHTSLNLGVNYAHGREQGTRQVASADFKLTWLPDPASFDRFQVSGEILHGKTEGNFGSKALAAGGPVQGSSAADGAYLYAQYRIGKDWEPGIRYDWFRPEAWAETDSNSDGIADGLIRSQTVQNSVSAYLTYNLSEFNLLRFQVSYLKGDSNAFAGKNDDWFAFLQWSAIIGAHKHSFQP